MSLLKNEFIGQNKKRISSRIYGLDNGLGGFAIGRIYEVYGEAGSGKTQLWLVHFLVLV